MTIQRDQPGEGAVNSVFYGVPAFRFSILERLFEYISLQRIWSSERKANSRRRELGRSSPFLYTHVRIQGVVIKFCDESSVCASRGHVQYAFRKCSCSTVSM